MTRNGKIARLPLAVREELNQRLENGEQGVRLVEWLNTSPEVKAVLAQDFEGQPINEVNLTQWKNGGFLDWQARQDARALLEEWQPGAQDPVVPPGDLADLLTRAVMTHYAGAVQRSNGKPDEEPSERVRRLGQSLRDVVRLGRYELARERAELDRERLELQRARLKNHKAGGQPDDKEKERLSHLEKAEMVKQMVRDAKAKQEEYESRKSVK